MPLEGHEPAQRRDDSLDRFAGLISTDTAVVRPRPGILAQRIARARADSIRIARATEVERAVTGRQVPRPVVDTPGVVRKNELSGSVRADAGLFCAALGLMSLSLRAGPMQTSSSAKRTCSEFSSASE